MTKSDFRAQCLKHLRGSSLSTKKYRDRIVNHELQKVLKQLNPKRVLAFWPMGMESDIRKTIMKFHHRSEIYMPFMDGVSFKMVPFRLPMERKAFGIYEPRDSSKKINIIDVAIVPVVGVDGRFRRIGFGKGMYDRFFPTLKSKPFTIFIQAHECFTSRHLCDDYDVEGDLLITPCGVYSRRGMIYVKRTTRGGRCRHP